RRRPPATARAPSPAPRVRRGRLRSPRSTPRARRRLARSGQSRSRAGRRAGGRGTARSSARGEEELLPGRPPVVGLRDDRPVVNELDAGLEAQLLRRRRALVLDLDLTGLAGVIRRDGLQVGQGALCAFLDELARALRRQHSRRPCAEPLFYLDGGQPLAEQRLRLA